MLRKLLSALTALTIGAATLLAAAPASATYLGCSPEGDGSEYHPYYICSAADFQQIVDFDNHYWALSHDIDMTGVTITPAIFRGNFNGNNYAIKNLTIDATGKTNAGLFAEITNSVHDLELKNVTVTGASNGYAGLLAGNISGSVERVKLQGSIHISTGGYLGGMAGQVSGSFLVKDALVNVEIASDWQIPVGGVVGSAQDVNPSSTPATGLGQLKNIIFNGHIANGLPAGSIAGIMNPSNDPNAPTCVGTTSVFSLEGSIESQSGTGCTHQITVETAQEATRATGGFGQFADDTWLFGDQYSLPILRDFPTAPSHPGVPFFIHQQNEVMFTFSPGFSGGSNISGFSIQCRRAGGNWYDLSYLPIGFFSGLISGLDLDVKYQIRLRTTNEIGSSDWVYAPNFLVIDSEAENAAIGAPQVLAPPLSDPSTSPTRAVALQDGSMAMPWVIVSPDGPYGLGYTRFDDQGRVLSLNSVRVADQGVQISEGYFNTALAQTTDGDLVMAWIENNPNSGTNQRTSKVLTSRSVDGQNWSAPVQIGATKTYDTTSPSCSYAPSCAYVDLAIKADGSNGVAVLATYKDQGSSQTLIASSSINGSAWTNPAVLSTSFGYNVSVIALKVGFMASWTAAAQEDELYAASLAKPGVGTWTAAQHLISTGASKVGYLVQRDAKTVSLVWAAGTGSTSIQLRDYDLKTKRWSTSPITVVAVPGQLSDFTPYSGLNGNVGLAYASRNNNMSTLYYLNILKGKTTTSPQVLASGDTDIGYVDLLQSGSDNAMVTFATCPDEYCHTYVSTMAGRAFTYPQQISAVFASTWNTQLDMNSNGKILAISYTGEYGTQGTAIEAVSITPTATPTSGVSASIQGIAKTGKTLVATDPSWGSFAPLVSVKYQWYRCNSSPQVNASLNGNCVAIPKGTASKYRLTKADKGKYITYVATAVSTSGTGRVVSPATAVIQ